MSSPYQDPYQQRPATNLYGQPVQPQQPPSPYGPYPGVYQVQAYPQGPIKSKVAAALLAFFVGQFGIHWFYLGRKALGFGHLALATLVGVLYIVGMRSAFAATGVTDSAALGILLAGVLALGNAMWAFGDLIYILVKPESELGR